MDLNALKDVRQELYNAQRKEGIDHAKAAAIAEEQAQVTHKQKNQDHETRVRVLVAQMHEQGDKLDLEALNNGDFTTLELRHAQILYSREKLPKAFTPPPPPPRMTERTKREMEAGAKASERASRQRELELIAGAATAKGLPFTPPQVDETIHNPVQMPAEPVKGVDQNKPFRLRRGS